MPACTAYKGLGQAGHPLVYVLVNKDTLYIDNSEPSILDKKAEA